MPDVEDFLKHKLRRLLKEGTSIGTQVQSREDIKKALLEKNLTAYGDHLPDLPDPKPVDLEVGKTTELTPNISITVRPDPDKSDDDSTPDL